MHGLTPQSCLECVCSFVLASTRLCIRTLTENDITVADLLLVQFCKCVHRLFGYEFVMPNVHLHNHLASCVHGYDAFGCMHLSATMDFLAAYLTTTLQLKYS